MVDLSGLSHDDVKEWVETVLAERREGDNVEAYISTVSMKLQLLSQDLNSELEKGLMDIVASFPRAMSEVDRFELLMKDLSGELGHVLGHVEGTDASRKSDPDDPVEILAQLHHVKNNMERCRETLTEAANWHQLVRDVNARFASGELNQLAEQLQAMKRSLAILKNMPEAAERDKTMQQLESQLEVVFKPRLQQAIQKETVSALQELAQLYRKLGKTETLIHEYAKARPSQLHRYWFAFSSEDRFRDWLPSFHKEVAGLLAEERRRCHEVFGGALAVEALCNLIVEIFEPIAESYRSRLSHGLSFPEVITLFDDSAQFLSAECGLVGLNDASSPLITHVVSTVFEPYVDFTKRYEELEQAGLQACQAASVPALQDVLSGVSVDGSNGDGDVPFPPQTEEVLDLCVRGFAMVEHLMDRCIKFSLGYHARELVRLITRFLTSDVGRFKDVFTYARRRCQLDTGREVSSAGQRGGDGGDSRPQVFDLDYLQGALRVMQAIGRHHQHVSTAERTLARALGEMYTLLFDDDGRGLDVTSAQAVALLWVRSLLDQDPGERADLKAFLRVYTQPMLPGDLLKGPFRSAGVFAGESRRLVFDVCMSVVKDRMSTIPTLHTWSAEDVLDPDVSYHSILPQPYITQVGEHILSLIQHLEDFAASDALVEASVVMTGLERLGEAEWRAVGPVVGVGEAEVSSFVRAMVAMDAHGHEGGAHDGVRDDTAHHMVDAVNFCNAWLAVIARAAVGCMLAQVLGIPHIGARGSQQLEMDTTYLITVLKNLEVTPHPMLTILNELAKTGEEELRQRVVGEGTTRGSRMTTGAGTWIRKIETTFLRVRRVFIEE